MIGKNNISYKAQEGCARLSAFGAVVEKKKEAVEEKS